jgi:hypothetical protein
MNAYGPQYATQNIPQTKIYLLSEKTLINSNLT